MIKKKGLSQVVSTVILIALSIALAAGVLTIVRSYVTGSLDSASSCNDILEKIIINPDYTCFDPITNSTLISISRSEFDLDSLLVSVSYEDSSTQFNLKGSPQNISGIKYYVQGGSPEGSVALPKKESGKTYCYNATLTAPSLIEIAPKRGTNQCQVVDSFKEIPVCLPSINCTA